METYRREYNALRRAAEAEKDKARRDLAKVEKQIEQIVKAVCEGLYHPSMKEKLTRLEARKAELTTLLPEKEEEPLRLHPGLADVYRKKIDALVEALNAEGEKSEAARILRGLLSEIRPVPEGDGLAIELVGELAAIMALEDQQKTKAPRVTRGRSITMVAGAGFEPATFRL